MEESAPGQFNFINSQLRMNENHVENQNEFEKMSLMVKNLVSCKIEHIFNDIDRAKEDLKMRIKIAIEAAEKASTSTAILAAPPQQIINANANAAESQAKINDLHKQIEDLKKGNDLNSQSKIAELNKQLEELNKQLEELDKKPAILPVTSSDDLTKANAEIATKGVSGVTIGTNMSNTDLELAKALARNKELEKALAKKSVPTASTSIGISTENDGKPSNPISENAPQSTNSRNKFTDFVIGHHTPE
jgi:hypothetical protein